MPNIQVRVDETLRAQAQAVVTSMGIDLASAVRMFLVQMIKENGLPFKPSGDPFYSPQNQAHLAKVIDDMNNGRNCSVHELIED